MSIKETRGSRQHSLKAFATGAALGIAACSGPMSGNTSLPELEDGSIRGELIDMIARFDDETTLTTYFLRVNGNERDQRELVLQKAPFLPPMAKIKVWGVEREGRIIVDRLEPVDPADNIDRTSTWQQPLINPTPITPTKLAMAVIDVGGGSNSTTDELQKRLFTNPNSTRQYYLENSYGAHDLVGMVSPKTYSYPMTTCDTSALAAAVRPMIDADVGQVSDIYLWYFGSKVTACSWSGLSSGKDTYYNASSSCVVLVQEPGHSFGMSHSSSMVCTDPAGGTAPVPIRDDLGAGDVQNCTHSEYGNRYDTMGGGCRHFNAYNKVYRRYFQQCNGVNVRKSGTFNLMPIEKPCNGIQTLQVPMPRVRGFFRTGGGGSDGVTQLGYYTVELRAPIGLYDNTMKPTVIINASPKWSMMSATGGRGSRGEHTWLLDMAPTVTGTGTDGTQHALAAGQTFTDPGGGVAITTMSVGPEGAVIKVDITGATTVPDAGSETVCLDGTPIEAPGPANCGDDGGGPPPPIDVVTPPPPTPDSGGARDAAPPPTQDVRVDAIGTGGTGGATGGTGGTGGATGGGAGSTGTGGATTGTGGATTGTGGATTGTGGATTGTGGTGTGGDTTGGTGARPTTPETPAGCGCRTPSASGNVPAGGYAVFGLALAGLLRRRSRKSA
jgi:MYXO-CTERM domain-containing protein